MNQVTIDVGTTQIKLSLFKNQQQIDEVKKDVATFYGDEGKVYQKPNEIVASIKMGIKELLEKGYQVEEILFSTAMHSIMPVFNNHNQEEMLIWLDKQAGLWIKKFKQNEEQTLLFYQKTGTPIHEMSPFAKIGHFKTASWFNQVKKWLGLKEYLMKSFTNQEVVDYSVASTTGLFNSETKKWDADILYFLAISENRLAKLVDTDWYTTITPEVADELGLDRQTKIYVGASDGCLASLGGFMASGISNTLTIGTSGAVRKLSKTRQLDSKGQTFCYYITKDYWVIGGATNNGGNVLAWSSQLLFNEDEIFSQINSILTETTIGSEGILFLPYIAGERAPLWSSEVTGEFSGLKITHKKSDMARSVIEGILFNLKWISEIVASEKGSVALSGGFFENGNLVQLTADILGINCFISNYSEPSYGLICLTKRQQTVKEMAGLKYTYHEKNNQFYEKVYKKYLNRVKGEL